MASLYSTKVTASGGRHGSIRSEDGLLDLSSHAPGLPEQRLHRRVCGAALAVTMAGIEQPPLNGSSRVLMPSAYSNAIRAMSMWRSPWRSEKPEHSNLFPVSQK
jgi:hypothetical protein